MLDDYRTAPLSERDRALFGFIEKMNGASSEMDPADVAAVVAAGWSEEAVYDALTVCALFNFYNKWIDASGVSDLPAAAYRASGMRLATKGYTTSLPVAAGSADPEA